MAQVIKKYIYLSGAKSNDPLHIVYVPNIFKFTKISAKGTQELLKWYERAQIVRDICKLGDRVYFGELAKLGKKKRLFRRKNYSFEDSRSRSNIHGFFWGCFFK